MSISSDLSLSMFGKFLVLLFVGWLLFYTIYYFIEYNNKFISKFVHSKETKIVWTSIPAILVDFIFNSGRGKKKKKAQGNKQLKNAPKYYYSKGTKRDTNSRVNLYVNYSRYKSSHAFFNENILRASFVRGPSFGDKDISAVFVPLAKRSREMTPDEITNWIFGGTRVEYDPQNTDVLRKSGIDIQIYDVPHPPQILIPQDQEIEVRSLGQDINNGRDI